MAPGMPDTSQCSPVWKTGTILRLRSVQGTGRARLNVVRSGRPEQFLEVLEVFLQFLRSQCSPVWKTGTMLLHQVTGLLIIEVSM